MSATGDMTTAEALDVDGVAAILGCSPAHVRALVRRGEFLRPAKLGALARWSRVAVLRWLEENTGPTAQRAGQAVQARG